MKTFETIQLFKEYRILLWFCKKLGYVSAFNSLSFDQKLQLSNSDWQAELKHKEETDRINQNRKKLNLCSLEELNKSLNS